MKQKHSGNAVSPKNHDSTLAVAAMFAEDFSIDWLIELTGLKATQILTSIDKAIKEGWLKYIDSGRYRFRNSEKKSELIRTLAPEVTGKWRRMIVDRIICNTTDKDEAVMAAAHHLLHLSNDEVGCRQLYLAGEGRRKAHQLQTALECYKKVIEDTRRKKSYEAYRLFTDAVIAYSKIVDIGSGIPEIIPLLKEGVVKARKRDDKVQLALLEIHLAKNEWFCSKFDVAYKHFYRGWELARKTEDSRLMRSVQGIAVFFLYGQGHYREVIEHYENVVDDVETLVLGRVPLLSAQFIGACYAYNGQITRGMGMLDTVYSHCQKSGDFLTGSYTGFHIGGILIELGRYAEATHYLEWALEKARQEGNEVASVLNMMQLSVAYYFNDNTKKSVVYMKKVVGTKEYVPRLRVHAVSHMFLALMWEMQIGRYPRVVTTRLDETVRAMSKGRDPFPKGVAYRYIALLDGRQTTSREKVIKSLLLSEKWLKRSGHEIQLARTRILLAREYLSAGNEQQAKTVIKKSSYLLDSFLQDQVPDDLRFLLKDLRTDKNLLKEIMKMGQNLVSIRNAHDLVNRILVVVNRITGAERSAIFLLNEDSSNRDLVLLATRNFSEEEINRVEFVASKMMMQDALQAGEFRSRLMTPVADADLLTKDEIRSCICVPLKLRDRVVGILYMDNRFFPNVFRESDSEILDYFAAQAAIALDNAAVHERNELLIQKLEGEKQYFEAQHLDDLSPEGFVGNCKATRRVLGSVKQVAKTDSTVLILGETGVGKELIARAIHQNSTRKDRPFIRVNCSAFPNTMIAAELFGHEKGAFTGAVEQRLGRFELADTGTLFLDEIGDISMEVQVSLLRVLQSHEFERIGGGTTLHSNFRLLTATNRNLEQAVKAGTFREDLFYRLNVFPIHIPPLRERKEDIPLLVSHFLKSYTEKLGKPLPNLTHHDMKRLVAYHWPGNVRELENVIERGGILSTRNQFRLPLLGQSGSILSENTEILTMEDAMRQHILSALRKSGGKVRGKGGAAEILDMKFNTLFSRMKKLGIERSDVISII
ncbi:sigma 54-interacting transcriptional regulator [bacterium]|nr:sigma 54-interacting transcriptional regulator [bacterium]